MRTKRERSPSQGWRTRVLAQLSSAENEDPGLVMRRGFGARAPHVDAGEQKQPDHVDEMPVPGSELEAEMLGGGEMAEIDADQADDQKRRADDHVRAVKSRGHEEGGAIDVAAEIEPGMHVLPRLHAGEG